MMHAMGTSTLMSASFLGVDPIDGVGMTDHPDGHDNSRSGRAGLTAKGRQTRQRIVGAAASLIHERGVAAVTLDDVRLAAGVSSSQLYHYFADKRALVHAVVDAQLTSVIGHVEGLELGSIAGFRAWRDAVIGHLERAGTTGGCPIGSLAAALADVDPSVREALATGFLAWEAAIRKGLVAIEGQGELPPGVDPAALATMILAVVQGGYLLAQVQRDVRPMVVALDTALRLITVPAAALPDATSAP